MRNAPELLPFAETLREPGVAKRRPPRSNDY